MFCFNCADLHNITLCHTIGWIFNDFVACLYAGQDFNLAAVVARNDYGFEFNLVLSVDGGHCDTGLRENQSTRRQREAIGGCYGNFGPT